MKGNYTKLDIDKSFAAKPMNRFELNDLLQKYKSFRDNIGKLMKSGSCTQADMKKLQTVRKYYDKIWDSFENLKNAKGSAEEADLVATTYQLK